MRLLLLITCGLLAAGTWVTAVASEKTSRALGLRGRQPALATFVISEPTGIRRDNDILVSGVPLPQGVVHDPARIALRDSEGNRLRVQVEPLARWVDKSLKWVLVTAPEFSIEGGGQIELQLTLGERSALKKGITLNETDAGLDIDTGKLRFTIAKTGHIIPALEVKNKDRWNSRAVHLDLAMTVEHNGRGESYSAALAPREIEVEVEGPLRTVVAVRGAHQAESGRTFGPYTLRFELIAGVAQLRLTHSVVYDGNPEKDFVRESEIVLKGEVGEDRRFGYGGDEGHEVRFQRRRASYTPDFRYAELYQNSATHWRIRRWVDRERREVFCEEGLHADGWMELSGSEGSVAVAVRDFWQNHPKTLAADAATGEVHIGLYPERADRLDLQRYSDVTYPQAYETPSFAASAETIPFDKVYGAHGIQKTHHVELMFDEPNPSAATLFYNRPLLLEWPLEYTAETKIVQPAAVKLNAEWEKRLDEYLDFLHTAMLRDGGTGYIDYLDLPHGFNVEEGRWYHDFGGWGYTNNECLPALGFWQAYLLTGRRDAFNMARAMTLHNADIDSYHAGPHAGLGSRHNMNHWGCMDKEARISQAIGKRFLYYLTGDRTVLDLNKTVMEMWRRRFSDEGTINTRADLPALVSSLLFAVETGIEDSDEWPLHIADAFAESVNELGQPNTLIVINAAKRTAEPHSDVQTPGFGMFSAFGGSQSLPELAERYDHQPLRDALVRMARYWILDVAEQQKQENFDIYASYSNSLNVFHAVDLMAYAYSQTKDSAFARYAIEHLQSVYVVIKEQPEPRYGVQAGGSRAVPVTVEWPDAIPALLKKHRNFFPLFSYQSRGQFIWISKYLHKMQGIMLLTEAAAETAGSGGKR